MKILHISHRHHIVGGSDSVFFATTCLLQSAGHQVVPFCLADPANEPSQWASYFPRGARTSPPLARDVLRYVWNSSARSNLNRLIADHGPFDVAHLHIYHGKHTASILQVLRRHQIPAVQTLHEYKLACPVYTMERQGRVCDTCVTHSTLNALRHRCHSGSFALSLAAFVEFHASRAIGDVRLINRFLCVSDFQRQMLIRAGLPANKLFVLRNFVDPPKASSAGQGDYLLYIGRIERLKGLETLINVARARSRRLIIAGTGSWQDAVERQISTAPNITFAGFVAGQALHHLIANARAVVVPSQWFENCPMSILEAKAMGRPVVAADIGGIPELVREGQDGFLFSPGDEMSLRQAFERLDRANWHQLSENAGADARARFSAAKHLDELLAHYRAAMKTGASAEPRRPLSPPDRCGPNPV